MLWHTTRLLAFVAATIALSVVVAALVDQIASAHQAEAPVDDPSCEALCPGSIAGDEQLQFARTREALDPRAYTLAGPHAG